MTEEQTPTSDEQAPDEAWDDVRVASPEPQVFEPDEGVGTPASSAFFADEEPIATVEEPWQPPAVAAYEPYYGTPAESWSTDRFESIMRDTIDAQAQEQKQLEQLLRDVRTALTALPAPDEVAATGAAQAALAAQVDRLAADLAAARAEQAEQITALAGRLEELASSVSAADPDAGPSTIQDLHDGIAGVRTDLTSLPDQIGPAVTSAVAHGLAGTAAQVGAVQEALADLPAVVAETAELRALVAEQAEHLALLPQAVDGLRDLTERVGGLEGAVASDPVPGGPSGPEVAAAVEESLAQRFEALGATVSTQLDALAQRVEALHAEVADIADAATPSGQVGLDPAAFDLDGRFGALHDELREMRLAAEGPTAATAAVEDRIVAVQEDLRAMRLATEGPASPDAALVALLHASEQRLAHHIDEAVLALAQAVLRRRSVVPPPYAGSSPLVPGSDETGPAPAPDLAEPADTGLSEQQEPSAAPVDLHDDLTDATAAEPPVADARTETAWAAADDLDDVDVSVDEPAGEDRLTGVLEAWAKGDPAPHVESASGWPAASGWPGTDAESPEPELSESSDEPGATDADDPAEESDVGVATPDVLPGRHRPGVGEKRGLFRRRG